jgi:hypothetical protein
MNRQRTNLNFQLKKKFAVSSQAECRFICLTQTDKDHTDPHFLVLTDVESFGTFPDVNTIRKALLSLRSLTFRGSTSWTAQLSTGPLENGLEGTELNACSFVFGFVGEHLLRHDHFANIANRFSLLTVTFATLATEP